MKAKALLKPICVFCAILLFAAVLNLPIGYYTFLRVSIFVGASIVVYHLKKRQWIWIVSFIAIAILFNPIVPIYLYIKAYWIPLDIISGILFLLVTFLKQEKVEPKKKIKKSKAYSRDKIY